MGFDSLRCTSGPARRALLAGLLLTGFAACRDDSMGPDGIPTDPAKHNPDWSEVTHGRTVPDYGVVFPQNSVNTLEISMTAAQWAHVRANMRALTGMEFGGNVGGGPGGGFTQTDPDYVDVTLRFNGKQWKNVGFRLKGNSSLSAAWRQGIYKLPFRLNMDRFEDSIPAVRNQRFYGFKELSLSAGFQDPSLVREKAAADILRMAGVPAARTAFYRVFIDFGQGLKYCGVYTAVEVIDDTMVADQFGDDTGNIYKPLSRLQAFSASQFEKKNNQAAADWSDARAFITALNSPLRTSDPAQWRSALEATFDVDHFLRWLAVNNAMVNWDSYGTMAHNYYLYNHPARRLIWIPWDHNEALSGSPGVTGGSGPTGPGGTRGLSLTMNEVAASWPLLRFLADDPVYFARYREHLRGVADSVLTEARINPMLTSYHQLITPWVVGANGEQAGYTFLSGPAAFTNALPALHTHVRNRVATLAAFLR